MSYTINFFKTNVWDFTSESEYVKEHERKNGETVKSGTVKLHFLRHRKKI